MQYRFEISSSMRSKHELVVACAFDDDEVVSALLYLNDVAIRHFGPLGQFAVGDELELHIYPSEGEPSSDWRETLLCVARLEHEQMLLVIRMLRGPAAKGGGKNRL